MISRESRVGGEMGKNLEVERRIQRQRILLRRLVCEVVILRCLDLNGEHFIGEKPYLGLVHWQINGLGQSSGRQMDCGQSIGREIYCYSDVPMFCKRPLADTWKISAINSSGVLYLEDIFRKGKSGSFLLFWLMYLVYIFRKREMIDLVKNQRLFLLSQLILL